MSMPPGKKCTVTTANIHHHSQPGTDVQTEALTDDLPQGYKTCNASLCVLLSSALQLSWKINTLQVNCYEYR